MEIKAIGVSAPDSSGHVVQIELGPDFRSDFSRARSVGPVAYLLPEADLAALAQTSGLRDLLIDCGVKDVRVELARVMLFRDRIPCIQGRYQTKGKALHSVRTLLGRAVRRNDRNVFLIGLPPEVFSAASKKATAVPRGWPAVAEEQSAMSNVPQRESNRPRAAALKRRMVDVPANIRERYLGDSAPARQVREAIVLLAPSNVPVLIWGEPGTGKKTVARLIHNESIRRDEPMQVVDCRRLLPERLQLQLFGGATETHTPWGSMSEGFFQLLHHGTLVLAEFQHLPLVAQRKVLHTIRHGEVQRRGAGPVAVDVRVIATTTEDLGRLPRSKLVHPGLADCLGHHSIRTPALREYPPDIPLLAEFIWKEMTRGIGGSLPFVILEALKSHSWRGNVNDLKKVLKLLYARHGTRGLTLRNLREAFGDFRASSA